MRRVLAVAFAILTSLMLSAQNIVQIDGVKYIVHDVVKGETLYSLSRKHGLSVDDIIAANPVLKDGLKSGQRIRIPMKVEEVQTSVEPQNVTHKVLAGETLYSLARKYSVTEDEIRAMNPHIKRGLKAGRLIVIPAKPQAKQQSVAEVAQTAPAPIQGVVAETPSAPVATVAMDSVKAAPTKLRTLGKGDVAEVALLLPLGSEHTPSQYYLDLYRGFLMGLDSVRMAGHSVNLTLHNTAHDLARVEGIIASGALNKCDLVVGPVYEDVLIPVAAAAERKGVAVVSPLANLTNTTADNVFQMSPSLDTKYDKVRALFDGSHRIVVIKTDNTDMEFDAEIKRLIGSTPFVEHKYIYEHPSIIEKREKERELAREAGLEVDDTPSPSDMAPLLQGEQKTLFVITSNNEVEVDRILAAIASANISLTARSQSVAPFVVYGNNRWNRYRNIDRSIFFANNVIMLSTYHARRSEPAIRQFDKRFVEEFGSLPSLYAYRGYDAAVVFVKALYNELSLEGERVTPLLTPYNFKAKEEGGIRINSEWIRVNYHNNYTITTE